MDLHEALAIPRASGGSLSATLEHPATAPRGAAIFAHCFTCTQQSKAAVAISRHLAAEGIACLRFDFSGLGESDGDFAEAGFASDVSDIVAATEALQDRFSGPLLLVGHSLGGAAVLAAAATLGERVAAVATIGAPADVPHVLNAIQGDLAAIAREGAGEVSIGGRKYRLAREFLERTREADLIGAVAQLRTPLLICHAPTDSVVGIENAARLFAAAIHPKSFLSLDGADHLLLEAHDSAFVAAVIASWAGRYLAEARP